jgi:hypothetical protein
MRSDGSECEWQSGFVIGKRALDFTWLERVLNVGATLCITIQ